MSSQAATPTAEHLGTPAPMPCRQPLRKLSYISRNYLPFWHVIKSETISASKTITGLSQKLRELHRGDKS
jgi:hypothetical protein